MRGIDEITAVAAQSLKNINHPRNVSKGDWHTYSRVYLFWLLLVEIWELTVALLTLWWLEMWSADITSVTKARQHVKHEAGDCLSFLAMIVDVTR